MSVDIHLTVLPCSFSIFTMSAIGYWAFAAHKPQPKHTIYKELTHTLYTNLML